MDADNQSKPPPHTHGERLEDIDQAKGLAILLVVFGHIVSRQPPAENPWYVFANDAVYAFHMAFFMFLSGVAYFARLRPAHALPEYFSAVEKRFMRLMPAYFVFAGIVIAGKLLAQQFGHVDNPVSGLKDLLNIVLFPMQSVSEFLWYLYALFVISALSLMGFSLTRGSLFPLLAVGAGLLFVPTVEFLAIGQITKYLFFFALGGLAVTRWPSYTAWVDKYWGWYAVLLLALIAIGWFYGSRWIVIALISIPALHGLCRHCPYGKRFLLFIGAMTFPIYLMNTMAIGTTKALMFKFISWDGTNFFIFFPVLFLAGVLLPIGVKKLIFARIAWMNRITS